MTIRVLITDDEPAGRGGIRALLAREAAVEIVGECATGPEMIRAILDHGPDLLFLDVQLPGKSGIAALEEIPPHLRPVTVFVTAYDEHAPRAFDLAAADYLVKPYSDDRFRLAFSRAMDRLEHARLGEVRRRLIELADHARGLDESPRTAERDDERPLERLAVRSAGGIKLLPMDEIGWIEATGDYARVHARAGTFLLRGTMSTLERRLDPTRFVRVHRSTIVNVTFIAELRGTAGGEHEVVLHDGTRRKVSDRGRDQLERLLRVKIR